MLAKKIEDNYIKIWEYNSSKPNRNVELQNIEANAGLKPGDIPWGLSIKIEKECENGVTTRCLRITF
jgi:hypothetical protein